MPVDLTLKTAVQDISESKKEDSWKHGKQTKSMMKQQIASQLSAKCGHKKTDMLNFLTALEVIAAAELKKNRKFVIPGIAMMRVPNKKQHNEGEKTLLRKQDRVKAKTRKHSAKASASKSLKNKVV